MFLIEGNLYEEWSFNGWIFYLKIVLNFVRV